MFGCNQILSSLSNIIDFNKSFQIQQGTINPKCARGHHYHPSDNAVDIFFFEEGKVLLALESIDGKLQELYSIKSNMVLIFPPHVSHTVWNTGDEIARFTTFKTWNYAVEPCSIDYEITVPSLQFNEAMNTTFKLAKQSEYGFNSDNNYVSQKIQG
ncbi:hypothetical protein BGP_1079 [Beggiatoa sp. PS]|nr:hypothetical protein BGP_1079 [Beggiatoa sp. PS]